MSVLDEPEPVDHFKRVGVDVPGGVLGLWVRRRRSRIRHYVIGTGYSLEAGARVLTCCRIFLPRDGVTPRHCAQERYCAKCADNLVSGSEVIL